MDSVSMADQLFSRQARVAAVFRSEDGRLLAAQRSVRRRDAFQREAGGGSFLTRITSGPRVYEGKMEFEICEPRSIRAGDASRPNMIRIVKMQDFATITEHGARWEVVDVGKAAMWMAR